MMIQQPLPAFLARDSMVDVISAINLFLNKPAMEQITLA